jgi:hypothetical protein
MALRSPSPHSTHLICVILLLCSFPPCQPSPPLTLRSAAAALGNWRVGAAVNLRYAPASAPLSCLFASAPRS